MSNSKYISQFMLECYNRGKVSDKERILIEKELAENNELLARYEEIKKSDEELRRRYPLEKFSKLYAIKDDIVTNFEESKSSQKVYTFAAGRKKKLIGLMLAAAVLCVLFSVFIFNKWGSSNKEPQIAEEKTENEQEIKTELSLYKDEAEIIKEERTASYEPDMFKTSEPEGVTEVKPEPQIEPQKEVYIAAEPLPDTEVRTRGGELTAPKTETVIITDDESNLNIPPGMSFIFDNMFANRDLSFVIIPSRIKSIGKNAFLGNPILSVTIGDNVSIEENAFPGNFAAVYNNYGKAGGTYTRSDVNSERWEKK